MQQTKLLLNMENDSRRLCYLFKLSLYSTLLQLIPYNRQHKLGNARSKTQRTSIKNSKQ